MKLSQACEYLKVDIRTFMEQAIKEKLERVEKQAAWERIKADPDKCNKCGGPNDPPGDICSECWGKYWKSGTHH